MSKLSALTPWEQEQMQKLLGQTAASEPNTVTTNKEESNSDSDEGDIIDDEDGNNTSEPVKKRIRVE